MSGTALSKVERAQFSGCLVVVRVRLELEGETIAIRYE